MNNWEKRVFPSAASLNSSGSFENLGKLTGPLCPRCGQLVYPTEAIRLSRKVQYHSKCFRCRRCENRLNLQNFYVFTDEEVSDVYCKRHIPLYPGHNAGSEYWGELGIRQALTLQRDNPLFYSAFDVREQGKLSRNHRRALEKRLAYTRRVCNSLTRLNIPFEDFQHTRSLSNSCETLSAFSCDDACSDIFYLPYPGSYTPQRCESPSVQFLLQEEDFTRIPTPEEKRASYPRQEGSVTFSDQVEVIQLSGSASSEEEETLPVHQSSVTGENPFNNIHSAESREELSEYVNAHLSGSDPKMSSFSDIGDIKFADDSSDEDRTKEGNSDSVFGESAAHPSQTPTNVDSRKAQMNEMRLRFLSGEYSSPPSIQIIPPTPPYPQRTLMDIPPPASFANPEETIANTTVAPTQMALETPDKSVSKESSIASTSSTNSSSSYSSSESDSSSEYSDHDTAPRPPSLPVEKSNRAPKQDMLLPQPYKAVPPGFVSGILPKPVSQQIPRRPNRPPPPPPTNIPPFRASDPPRQPGSIDPGPVYMETDLDAFIDPAMDEIFEEPSEMKPLRPTSRSKSIDDLISSMQHGDLPEEKSSNSRNFPTEKASRDSETPVNQIDRPPISQDDRLPIHAPSKSLTLLAKPRGNYTSDSMEQSESPYLTAPSWETVERPSSSDDSDSTSSGASSHSSEAGVPETEPVNLDQDDVHHGNFALTVNHFPPAQHPQSKDEDTDSSSSSESDSESDSSSSGSEENYYDPNFTYKTSSSLPDLLDELDADDSERHNSDPSSEVVQISSISDLLKFSAEHTHRQRVPRPSAPPPPRPQSQRVVLLKGPARNYGNSSPLNLMSGRSPRLRRKELTNSLPVIFERSESAGEVDLKQKPKIVIRNRAKSESSSSDDEVDHQEVLGRAASSTNNAWNRIGPAATLPNISSKISPNDSRNDPLRDPRTPSVDDKPNKKPVEPDINPDADDDDSISLHIDCKPLPVERGDAPNVNENEECDDLTTDLDDLSPLIGPLSPKMSQPKVLQETDLDDLLQSNMNILSPDDTSGADDPHNDSTATLSLAENHPDDGSTTSESSDHQLGEMEPVEVDDSLKLESESVSSAASHVNESVEDAGKTSSLRQMLTAQPAAAKPEVATSADKPSTSAKPKSPVFNIVLKPRIKEEAEEKVNEEDDHEVDAAPMRPSIRSLIADLEQKSRGKPAEVKPKILPKPKPRRDSASSFIRGLQAQTENTVSDPSKTAFVLNNEKELSSPSEKENTQRIERPMSSSPRPILRDNLPTKSEDLAEAIDKVKASGKADPKPEYMNDYVPALMTHMSSTPPVLPPKVIDVYPVYQQNPPPFQSSANRGPPPPILPKPTKKPPLAPKPKILPKPKITKGEVTEEMSPPPPPPPVGFSGTPESQGNLQETVPDVEAVKELVDDVVRSRQPMQEDAQKAEAARQEEMRKRREEERSREKAHEALRAASKYQRSNEIASNVIDMDRAIDEASTHISSIDNTLDRITGFNLHFMHTLEGMPDGEVSDIELDTRSVQTNVSLSDSKQQQSADPTTMATSTKPQSQPRPGGPNRGVGSSEAPGSSRITSTTPAGAGGTRGPQSGATPANANNPANARKSQPTTTGGQKKPWEEDSLSSDSSSGSSSSSYTDSSGSSSSSESSDEEPVKSAPPVGQKKAPSQTAPARSEAQRAPVSAPIPPPQENKPPNVRRPRDISNDPFRTRHVDADTVSIASSTISQPERLRMPDKVERFEKAIVKASGGREPPPPLPPPRNPFTADQYRDHRYQPPPPPEYVNTSPEHVAHSYPPPPADYMNTSPPLPTEKFKNPIPKPRTVGSSAESVESPQHERHPHHHHHHRSSDHNGQHSHHGAEDHHRSSHHKKKKRDSKHEEKQDPCKPELHYASSLVDVRPPPHDEVKPENKTQSKKMIRDADRKVDQARASTLSIERPKKDDHPQDRRSANDNVFIDNPTTLTRRRPPQQGGQDPGRSSVIYRESDEEEEDVGRFGNRMTSLFKKKKLGEKDKKHPATSKAGTLTTRPGEMNPHQRSLSVDARARKQRNAGDYKSSESLMLGPDARASRARSSERRSTGRRDESGEWLPTMDYEDDDMDPEYRRRSAGDGFYAAHERQSRERTLRSGRNRAQSEDYLVYDDKDPRAQQRHRESANYFEFDTTDESDDSDFDSPRFERGKPGPDEYVNLPSRHGRSKSFDVLRDPKPPPRGFEDTLPGRLLRGRPGKSGPGSVASSMMSVGDVRGKDIGELQRMVERYLERGRAEKLRTLLRALMIEDRDKMENLMSGFNDELRQLVNRWSSGLGGERGTSSSSDLLLSTLLLHGAGYDSGTHQRGSRPGLHTAPSVATILRTVYMKPGDQEEPPPGMRPPPRPTPPAMGKASLISDELNRIDMLAQEVANYDQTTFKELVAVLTHNCQTEVEKVRALFCWLTVKDLTRLDFDPYAPPESLLGMLRSVKLGEVSYHDLFRRLCHYCGIHCEIIFGYSKGAGYRPGMNLKDTRMFENQWTAVYVANSWRFVNVAWGTPRDKSIGTMDAIRPGQRDDFYFLTDPEQHIFEHFPYQKRWQLMKRPVTLEKFMNLPVLKSSFFNAGLSLKKAYQESLTTKDGRVIVRLVMPRFVGVTCSLENRADMTELKGLTLVRVMGEEVAILANPSQPGRYYLNIFVSPPEDWKDTTRTLAASFQIRCSEHNYDRLVVGRYPPVGFLGRTPASQKFGVSVVGNPDPLIVWNDKEVVRIPLAIAPGLKMMHRMQCFERHGKDSRDCQEYALVQSRGKRTMYCIRCPANGYYYITLYAGLVNTIDTITEDMTPEGLECVHSFLIDCRRPMTGAPPFPIQSSRWNGCYLMEPTHRLLEVNRKYTFRLEAPHCSSVAVVVNGRNWLDLKKNKNGVWYGKIFTGEELGELSVYGMFSSGTATRRPDIEHDPNDDFGDPPEAEENYDKLLDYEIVVRQSHR